MGVLTKKIHSLNTILRNPDFYPFLCAASNNEIDEVIENLTKVINYVLTTEEESLESIDLNSLITKARAFKKEGNYLIYATNSYMDNTIRLFGIKPSMSTDKINRELTNLNIQLSYFDFDRSSYFPVYGTVKKAVNEGFTHPKSLYKGILKEPTDDKRPFIVGETETEHYSSILQRRLKNIPDAYQKTGAKTAKKILKEIIGKDVSLYFISPDKYEPDDYAGPRVSPLGLDKVTIPSRYTLLTICAKNKRLAKGTKLSIDDGTPYEPPKEDTPKAYSSLRYTVYERIPVTENFLYSNEELSGDVKYDIDDLYGFRDPKNNRESLNSMSLDERLKRIQNSFDINLTLRDGKYQIDNGRHRIVFLKYYYLSNYLEIEDPKMLQYLKDSATIIANVDHTIEDPEINKYLIFFEQHFKNVQYFKTNIQNDKFDIIIVVGNYCYHIGSKEDLMRFVKKMRKEEYNNEYFIGLNSNFSIIPYDVIIAKLVSIFGFDIIKMDLMDIINYLQTNDLIINNEVIDMSRINYERLYVMFTSLIQNYRLDKYRKLPPETLNNAQRTLEEFSSGRRKK